MRSAALEFGPFAASFGALQGARLAFSLAVATAIAPAAFTVWALVVAALNYLPIVTLGSITGMAREVPYLAGARRPRDAAAAEATTWWAVGAGLVAIALGSLAISYILPTSHAAAIGVVLGLSLVFQAQQSTFQARLQFSRASRHQAALAGATAIGAAVVAAGRASTFGAVAAVYCGCVAAGLFVGFVQRLPALGGPSRARAIALVQVGLPLAAAAFAFGAFTTSDRWVATAALGTAGAAPYALARTVASGLLVVPIALFQQAYPGMAATWGEGSDVESLLSAARHHGLIALAAAVPSAIAIGIAGFLLLPRLLPHYQGAALPTAVLAGGLAVQTAFTGYGNVLNVVGRQWTYLAVQVAAIVVGTAMMVGGVVVAGALGLAVASAGAFIAYGVALRAVATRSARAT